MRGISLIAVLLLTCISFSACKASNQNANNYVNSNGYKFSKSSVKTPKGLLWPHGNTVAN